MSCRHQPVLWHGWCRLLFDNRFPRFQHNAVLGRARICTAGGRSPRTTGAWTWCCAWRVCRVNVDLAGPAHWGATAHGSVARHCTHAKHVRCESARVPLCVPWPHPDARPPLQSQTLCALMPPLIRKRGRASAIYLVSGGTSWNDRLIFFGWDA